MSKVVPFNPGLPALPPHLMNGGGSNDDLKEGLNRGMVVPPRLTIGGKVFAIVQDGVEERLTRSEDGIKVPVTSLNVVVLRANRGLYKLFYESKYDPEGETEAPTCYSYDGITPSPMAQEPQCTTCAACPQNRWGSKVTEQGNKTRACSDNKLLAVIALSAVTKNAAADTREGQAYQLKVTPSALNRSREDRNNDPKNATSLTEYVNQLDNYPIDNAGGTASVAVNNVATRVFFDVDADYPLLRFKLAGFLTPEQIAYVKARAEGEDVTAIVTEQGIAAAPALPAPKAEAAKPKLAVAPPPPKVEDDDGFGGIEPALHQPAAPAAPAEPKKRGRQRVTAETAPATPADVDAALAELGSLF